MSKLKTLNADGQLVGYTFYCPACEAPHIFYTSGKLIWSFNGDFNSPTFTLSLLNTWHDGRVCHLVVEGMGA